MTLTDDAARVIDGRKLLVVTAHPDDESFAFGGTIARCADRGGEVTLLCLTRGELGWAGGAPRPSFIPELARIRTGELQQAATILGIATTKLLEFPDSRLHEVAPRALVDVIKDAVETCRPDVVLTFGEDGLYWHKDHAIVFYRTVTAVSSFGGEAPRLLHATLARGSMREIVTASLGPEAGRDFLMWGISPDAFGLHAEPASLTVDVQDYAIRKLNALRCHGSQLDEGNPFLLLSDTDAVRLLGHEYYHRTLETTLGIVNEEWRQALTSGG